MTLFSLSRTSAVLAATVLCASSGAYAQSNSPSNASQPPDLDLKSAVTAALESSATLKIAAQTVAADRARESSAASAGRPQLNAGGQFLRFDAATRLAFNENSPPVTVVPDHTVSFTLTAEQRLDLFGRVRGGVNQARLQTAVDTLALDSAARQKTLLVTVAYYALLRARHQIQVAEAALRAASAQEKIARQLNEAGVGQKIDLLRAQTNVSVGEQDVERAKTAADIALAAFNDQLGRPLDTPANLADTPGASVGIDLPASPDTPVGGDTLPFAPFAPPADLPTLETSVQNAQQNRAEILIAQAQIQAATLGINLARLNDRPNVSIGAIGGLYPTFSLQSPRPRTATLSLNIQVPIIDGGLTRSRIAEASAREKSAQLSSDQARAQVALEVTQARLNLESAARLVTSANHALAQAVAARRLAQIRYAGQVGLFIEVADAQAALVRAENAQVDAVYDYQVARARFDAAVGR